MDEEYTGLAISKKLMDARWVEDTDKGWFTAEHGPILAWYTPNFNTTMASHVARAYDTGTLLEWTTKHIDKLSIEGMGPHIRIVWHACDVQGIVEAKSLPDALGKVVVGAMKAHLPGTR